MSINGWLQILLFCAIIVALTRPIGGYLFAVFESGRPPLPRVLGRVERALYRLCGVDASREQTWLEYAVAMLVFSALGLLVTYLIDRRASATSQARSRSTPPRASRPTPTGSRTSPRRR
jgi:K+-transporting ATPase ATPase A chain